MKFSNISKSFLLLVIWIFFSYSHTSYSQTTKTVLDNYFKAIGGKEKALQVETFSSLAKGTFNNKEIVLETKCKTPNKLHSVMKLNSTTISEKIFDGKKGTSFKNNKTTNVNSKKLKQLKKRRSIFPEFNYYNKAIYEGVAKIKGKQTHILSIDDYLIFYDAASGLKIKGVILEQSEEKPKKEFFYSKYIEIEGLLFPSKLSIVIADRNIELQSISIAINRDVSDTDFY